MWMHIKVKAIRCVLKKIKQNCLGCITCATTEKWPLEGLQWKQGSPDLMPPMSLLIKIMAVVEVLNPMDPSPLDYSKWALSQFERNIQAKLKKCFLKLQAIKPQKPNVLFWCYFSVFFPPTVPLRNYLGLSLPNTTREDLNHSYAVSLWRTMALQEGTKYCHI